MLVMQRGDTDADSGCFPDVFCGFNVVSLRWMNGRKLCQE